MPSVLAANPDYPRTCIIGAGSSGIAVAKVLHEHGVPFDVYETSDRIGGNWVFKNANGMSSAYRSLHINTSRDKMAYSDFPLPRDYPDYPHHAQIARYFDSYADHFGIRGNIKFRNGVTRADYTDEGLWRIKTERGGVELYDALVAANGHHWNPRFPEPAFPGKFEGEQIHSHAYIDPEDPIDCRDKNVLVVGFGNSALDIACELGRKGIARNLFLSQRRGYWVIPKYTGGQVLDAHNPHPAEDTPLWQRLIPKTWLRSWAEKRLVATAGRPEDYGLPKPDHSLFATHPAISQEIYIRVGSGDVLPKPNIRELQSKRVAFVDGTVEDIDVIVWCTGYKITFPFFDEGFITAPNNDIALWKRMIDPRFKNLFFSGLVQPLCAMMPIAEEQAKLIAEYLTGAYAFPPVEVMDEERIAMHERAKRAYVRTPRHTIQINCAEYTRDLRRELARGRARAVRGGHLLPVVARATAAKQQDVA
jgi:cation diffusion facilitator CzcD-associated flavoprotein CzcO